MVIPSPAPAIFRKPAQPQRLLKRLIYADPAPGFRDAGSRTGGEGALWNVGNNGYSWSSSISGINGLNLEFNYNWLNPSNANNRGYGFQVRCLQAFIRRTLLYNSDNFGTRQDARFQSAGELTAFCRANDKFNSPLPALHAGSKYRF